jgi:tetratricopeptide (TPR) repeat protein
MMPSIKEVLHQIIDPNLSTIERAQLRCRASKQFEQMGNYDAAREVVRSLWPMFGERPTLDELDVPTSAEVLLRVGVLTGWIGSSRLIKGAQEVAKNLISESISLFESLPEVKKVAEAQIEIALCHMRQGGLDLARTSYAKAAEGLDDQDGDLKARALLGRAIIELLATRVNDSLIILRSAVGLFEASTNHTLRGSFHNSYANVLKHLGASEDRPDYVADVLREYTAARFHFEQAGHVRYLACVENNLAMLYLQVGRFALAHEHVDRAQALLTPLGDAVNLAEFEETRTRVLLAEGGFPKASKLAESAIRLLEKGDHQSFLSEALTTQGIALSRLHRHEQARATFERAITIAEQARDRERAGLGALTLLEQLFEHLSDDELCASFERAHGYLKDTQNTMLLHRLTECAWRVLSVIYTTRPDWTSFSLNETLRRHEARFIQMALQDAGGSVTKAAGLLGLPGHQTLSFMLNTRHRQLLKARTPVKPRRRRLVS